jgi:carboxylesterase
MTRHPHIDPSPFTLDGGPVGVLLVHGFTGSPPEMRAVGDFLHRRGLTVSAPLLPGHGTTVEEMNRCKWTDWTAHAEEAWTALQARCATVFVGGLSMGSLLALYMAATHPELAGAILYSPALLVAERLLYLTPILKYLIPARPKASNDDGDLTDPEARLRSWSYEENPVSAAHELLKLIRRVRRLLPQVTCPLLIVHSTLDCSIHPKSVQYTYERVGSADKKVLTLHNSGHNLLVDSEREFVAEETYRFISDRALLPPQPPS